MEEELKITKELSSRFREELEKVTKGKKEEQKIVSHK